MAATVPADGPAPRRVLEVGAGTGAVTRRLVRRLTSDDVLVVVEVNAAFCTLLRTRIAVWASGPCAPRVEIVEGDVLAYAPGQPFDHVVSSLPFNAFPEPLAGRITAALRAAVGAGGTLTFFEYVGLRALRRWTDRSLGRSGRLAVEADLLPHVVASRHALWNVPPATVHTVRFT